MLNSNDYRLHLSFIKALQHAIEIGSPFVDKSAAAVMCDHLNNLVIAAQTELRNDENINR